ncbi:MAG: hypothetical protein ACRDSZ_04755, partial [Pseudonocardiaceae bacterium]
SRVQFTGQPDTTTYARVTREDIVAIADSLHGSKRHHTLSVLRSLFRPLQQDRHHLPRQPHRPGSGSADSPMESSSRSVAEVREALAAADTPAARLALALAAIHAARPKAIRELLLDDVTLGNLRLVIAGHARPWTTSPVKRSSPGSTTAVLVGPHSQPACDRQLAEGPGDWPGQQGLDHQLARAGRTR